MKIKFYFLILFSGIVINFSACFSETILPKLNIQGALLPSGKSLEDFKLQDDNGKLFHTKDWKGHWSLVFFGFSHCGFICPLTLSELNKAYVQLQDLPAEKRPKVYFISLDPTRDSVNRLHQYIRGFNPDFIALRGEQTVVDKLSQEMSVVSLKVEDAQNPKNYILDHSSSIMLINPNGELQAFLSAPHKAQQLNQDYRTLLKNLDLKQ